MKTTVTLSIAEIKDAIEWYVGVKCDHQKNVKNIQFHIHQKTDPFDRAGSYELKEVTADVEDKPILNEDSGGSAEWARSQGYSVK